MGHHGSASSSSKEFLEEVNPEYAVISVGEDNSYSHPAKAALDRLNAQDAEIYRTDLQGEILMTSDGETIQISTKKENEENNSQAEEDYILNTNTKKFHHPSCKSAKRTKNENKQEFHGTKQELLSMGYKACKNCNP